MKFLLKIWDLLLIIFAFSTTKHCDKITIGENEDFTRGTPQKKPITKKTN